MDQPIHVVYDAKNGHLKRQPVEVPQLWSFLAQRHKWEEIQHKRFTILAVRSGQYNGSQPAYFVDVECTLTKAVGRAEKYSYTVPVSELIQFNQEREVSV